jgi:S1-C subfamily serine protease
MYRAQCTWDAAMGWNALQALKRHGGENAIMVVLIGAGHVAYGLGAERQARLWFDGKTASVIPIPVREDESEATVTKVQASYADFVWGLPPSTDPVYPTVGISTPEQKTGERYKVIMVAKDSPAAAAGFKVGDELVSIEGVPYTDKETVNRLMSEKRWGDALSYKVLRDGQEQALVAYLRRQPPKPPAGKPAAGAAQ